MATGKRRCFFGSSPCGCWWKAGRFAALSGLQAQHLRGAEVEWPHEAQATIRERRRVGGAGPGAGAAAGSICGERGANVCSDSAGCGHQRAREFLLHCLRAALVRCRLLPASVPMAVVVLLLVPASNTLLGHLPAGGSVLRLCGREVVDIAVLLPSDSAASDVHFHFNPPQFEIPEQSIGEG
jgi:hypothetical protein